MDKSTRGCAVSAGVLRGVDAGEPGQDTSMDAPLVREATPRRACIARQIGQARLRPLACSGRPHATPVTGGIAHAAVWARVALRLATVRRGRLLGRGRAPLPDRGARARPVVGAEWRQKSAEKFMLLNLVEEYTRDGQLVLKCWCAPLACHSDVVTEAIVKICAVNASHKEIIHA